MSSYAALPCRSLAWNRGIKLNYRVTLFRTVSRSKRFANLSNAYPLRLEAHRSRGRCLSVTAFKGNAENGEIRDQSSKSDFSKNSVRTSYVPQDTNSNKLQDVSFSGASQPNDAVPRSQAIQKLFRHWLTLLWTDSEPQIGEQIMERPATGLLHPQKGIRVEKRSEALKVVLGYFLALDAPVKIPLLIFVPLFVAVNLIFGSEVSKELLPLWIIGPFVAALYVKMIQGLATLYLFSLKHGVKLWKDFPSHYNTLHQYLATGKLKELVQAQLRESIESKTKWEIFEDGLDELSGWFSQLFWPVRYRIIKVLKAAKLM